MIDTWARFLVAPPQAGAAEKGVPLYKHIADLAGNSKLVSSGLKGTTRGRTYGSWGRGRPRGSWTPCVHC